MKGSKKTGSLLGWTVLLAAGLGLLTACGEPKLAVVEVKPQDKTVLVGETVDFTALGMSEKRKELPGLAFTWQVEGDAATIDAGGKLTAQKPGEVQVQASSAGLSGSAKVTIVPRPVARLEAAAAKERDLAGSTIAIRLKGFDQAGNPAAYARVSLRAASAGTVLPAESLTLSESGEAALELTLAPAPGENVMELTSGEARQSVTLQGTAVTRLVLLPEQREFEAGQKVAFQSAGADEFGNQRPLEARRELKADTAELLPDGAILMREPGKGILLLLHDGLEQGFPFAILPGKVARLAVEPTEAALTAGESQAFAARAFNAQDYPLTVPVQWTVEGEIGTIAGDGSFTAKGAGAGTVVAGAQGTEARIPVKVQPGPLNNIEIETPSRQFTAGEEVKLQARGADAYGNLFPVTVQWYLSKSLGTIDPETSIFKPTHAGSGQLKAMVGSTLSSLDIEVKPGALARLELAPQTVDVVAGESVQFEVRGFDAFGNAVDSAPEFKAQDDLGPLSAAGLFEARRAGNTMVEARMGELTAQSSVAVAPAEMETVLVKPAGPMELVAGKPQEFQVTALDRFDNPVTLSVAWRVKPELGLMGENHVFAPQKAGKGQLLVSVTQPAFGKVIEAGVDITVVPGDTARIALMPGSLETVAGRETQFAAKAYDRLGNETGAGIEWAVEEPARGEITVDGLFQAVRSGEGRIVARTGSVQAEAALKVQPAEVVFLKIIPESLSLAAGEEIALRVIGEDRFGNAVQPRTHWRLSEAALAGIGTDGRLKAGREGKGHLLATAGSIVDVIPIEVRPGPLSLIRIDPPSPTVRSGAETRFTARGFDAGGNSVSITPEWSMPEALGAIDPQGVFRAVKAGTGEVTARAGGVEGKTGVRVVPGDPAQIRLKPEAISLRAGETVQLSFEILDAGDNPVTDPEYRWEATAGVGRVAADQVFHARKAGQGELRLLAGAASAAIPVKVEPGAVHAIRLKPEAVTLTAGQETAFSAEGFDALGNRTELEPVWSVSGALGRISGTGEFTALRSGQGHAVIQMGAVSGLARIEVQPGPVARIEVEPPTATLRAGESLSFKATAFDAQGNVTPAEFSLSLEDEPLLGVLEPTGTFHARKAGSGRIAAAAAGVSGEAPIRVEPGEITRITLEPPEVRLRSGERLAVRVQGTDAFDNRVDLDPRFTVEPAGLLHEETDGSLLARAAGAGTLTATADGLAVSVPIAITPGDLATLEIPTLEKPLLAGKAHVFKATSRDAWGNLREAEVSWAVSPSVGRIDPVSGTFHATRAGTGRLAASSGSVVSELEITVQPGPLHALFIAPNPVTVKADQLQSFEVRGLDVEGNPAPVAVEGLQWRVLGPVGAFEKPGQLRAMKLGRGKITAALDDLMAEAYVTTIPGEPDPANSRIRLTHPLLPADGQAFSEVILVVRDAYLNPVPGVKVTLVSSREADRLAQPGESGPDGQARGRISASSPGTSAISAVIPQGPFRDTATVTFE